MNILLNIGANYQFVCQNQTSDEKNRVVIRNDNSISCEMMKINKTFFEESNLWNKQFFNLTWTIEYKAKDFGLERLLTGFQNSPDVEEKTGFPLCSPRINPQGILWLPTKNAYIASQSNQGLVFHQEVKKKFKLFQLPSNLHY